MLGITPSEYMDFTSANHNSIKLPGATVGRFRWMWASAGTGRLPGVQMHHSHWEA